MNKLLLTFFILIAVFATAISSQNWESQEYQAQETVYRYKIVDYVCYIDGWTYQKYGCSYGFGYGFNGQAWVYGFGYGWIGRYRCLVEQRYCTTVTVTRYRRVCKTGWSQLPDCLIPICSNGCLNGQVCTGPNKCSCVSTSAICPNVACSASNNCYPGTCDQGTCKCDPSFTGSNCEKALKKPTINKCEVQVKYDSNYAPSYPCTAEGAELQPIWIKSSIKELIISYEVDYTHVSSIFPPVSYVKEYKFGITYSNATLDWNKASPVSFECPGLSYLEPKTNVKCDIKISLSDYGFPNMLTDNSSFNVAINALLGGYKEGSKLAAESSNFEKQQYTSLYSATRSISFQIDNTPPTHCILEKTVNCSIFPISIENDITSESRIRAFIYNWKDPLSGVANYTAEVFFLALNQDGIYTNPANPFLSVNVLLSEQVFYFDVTRAGVYSLVLTVKDLAGNTAKARNIFVYTDKAELRANPDMPVKCTECNNIPNSNLKSITSGVDQINIDWTGYFITKNSFNPDLTKPVQPWQETKYIDDALPGDSFGLRTIHEFNSDGIIYIYSYGYVINPKPSDILLINSTVETKTKVQLNLTGLEDGSVVKVGIFCRHIGNFSLSANMTIIFDNTIPLWRNTTKFISTDQFNSRLTFGAYDEQSGIKSIYYNITDLTEKVTLKSTSEVPVITRENPKSKSKRQAVLGPCMPADTDCYCTRLGDCFARTQYIDIDNCLIDRKVSNNLYIGINVINYAGLSSFKNIPLNQPSTLVCRPAPGLSSGTIAGIVIGVLLAIFVLVLLIILLVWVYVLRKPMPQSIQNMKNRFTRSDMVASTDNQLYTSGPTDVGFDKRQQKVNAAPPFANKHVNAAPPYAYNNNNMAGGSRNSDEIDENELIIGDELSNSGFLVSKATWMNAGKKVTVATKGLKRGASSQDAMQLRNKIMLLRKLPTHMNIIKFFGAIEDFRQTGPLMVMEFSPLSLDEWLSKVSPSAESLDEMSLFCLNIAKGVEFLHQNKILHTRLAVRNILLAKYYDQYVAKVTGFGLKEDSNSKVSAPTRWLAPETLVTLKKGMPTYNEKTDSWSYGITVWEIYQFAREKPYSRLSNDHAQAAIKNGEILDRPESMPMPIYNDVMRRCCTLDATSRPSFRNISEEMENFRNGGGGGSLKTGYYTASDDYYAAGGGYMETYSDGR